jgi:NAD(P)H-dependent FMN reductase
MIEIPSVPNLQITKGQEIEMNIVLLSGSNRQNGTSTKLLKYMADQLENRGIRTTMIDVYEKPLPMYSPDASSIDANTSAMVQAFSNADGIILGGPEYHGSISGALKNALDFMGAAQFDGKPVLSVSSSGGAVGVSSLTQLHAMVRNLHGVNCPEWVSLGGDARQFAGDHQPADAGVRQRVERALDSLVSMTKLLRGVQQESAPAGDR